MPLLRDPTNNTRLALLINKGWAGSATLEVAFTFFIVV